MTLTFTYGPDSKPIAGIKIIMTESDGTITVLTTDVNGQITLPSTTNTYTLEASLAETGSDPISVQDALYILQHIVELRTLDAEQIKAADINGDGNITIQDALKVLQHNVELTTLNQSLIFLDADTGEALSATTFNPGDTPTITVIKLGDTNQSFDPSSITDHAPILTGKTTLTMDENETTVSTLLGTDADGDTLTYSITGGVDKDLFSIDAATGVLSFIAGPDYEDPGDTGGDNLYDVEITVSDGTNDNTQALIISVLDLNEKLGLTNKIINENEAGAEVGDLSINDTDFGNTNITYALSGDDAEYFTLDGSTIKLNSDVSANYEVKTKYTLTVTATNSAGETITEKVVIKIANVNEAVNLTTALLDQSNNEDNGFSFTIPNDSFTDIDGDTLTYTVTLDDGSALPSWLSFDAATQTFTGTPLNADVGVINVTVTATDGSFSVTDTFTLTVVNTNDDPTALSLSATAIDENSLGGVIGDLATTDDDNINGDTHTYTLSGTDAASFEVVNNQLKLKAGVSANYETKSTYAVTVTTTDGSGSTFAQSFNVTVNDVNDAPTAISLTATAIDENAVGTTVGYLSSTDEDAGDNVSYSLVGPYSDYFEINDNQLKLKDGVSLNCELRNSISIIVKATDDDGLSSYKNFTFIINDLNDDPTAIKLASNSIEDGVTGASIGKVIVDDEDIGDSFTYSLNDDRFEIVDGILKLKTGQSLNSGTEPTVVIDITATDSQGSQFTQNLTLRVGIVQLDNYTFDENALGVSIGNISVSGLDAGSGLTYSLSGEDARYFEITDQGVLKLKDEIGANYERDGEYSLVINAKNNSGESISSVVNLSVNDIEEPLENAYMILGTNNSDVSSTPIWVKDLQNDTWSQDNGFVNIITVPEKNENQEVYLFTIDLDDPDAPGTYNLVVKSVSGFDVSSFFRLDSETGAVYLKAGSAVDFETSTGHYHAGTNAFSYGHYGPDSDTTDGVRPLIFSIDDGTSSQPLLWSQELSSLDPLFVVLKFGDTADDGSLEIGYTMKNSEIYGGANNSFNQFSGSIVASAGGKDITGDGIPDAVFLVNDNNYWLDLYIVPGGSRFDGALGEGGYLITYWNNYFEYIPTDMELGDINGDGYADIIFGFGNEHFENYDHDYNGSNLDTDGIVEILHGAPLDVLLEESTWTTFLSPFGLSEANFGDDIAVIDINNDGYDDIVVGAPYADESDLQNLDDGSLYILYGQSDLKINSYDEFAQSYEDSDYGLSIQVFKTFGGIADSEFGDAVATGDFNGDGLGDFAVSMNEGGLQDSNGLVYIYLGQGFGGPQLKIIVNGIAENAYLGYGTGSLNNLGDINGDGFDDLGMKDNDGRFFIVWGRTYWEANYDYDGDTFNESYLIDLYDNSTLDGIYISGTSIGEDFTFKGVGDVNGDGYSDFVISAPYASWTSNYNGQQQGITTLVYGQSTWLGEFDDDDINTVEIKGNELGHQIIGLGDFDNDGFDEFAFSTGSPSGDMSLIPWWGNDRIDPSQAEPVIQLDSFTVTENNPGAIIGNLSMANLLESETVNYNTITISGDFADSFIVSQDGELRLKYDVSLDFEDKSNIIIQLSGTTSEGNSFNRNFTIKVVDVNEAPDFYLSNSFVSESDTGAVIGLVNMNNGDENDTYSYVISGDDADFFEISENGEIKLKDNVTPIFSEKQGYNIIVTATDASGLTHSQAVMIAVNMAPVEVILDNNTIDESQYGLTVGNLSVTDLNVNENFSYEITGADQDYFEITTEGVLKLKDNTYADYEIKDTLSITVKATDQGGLTTEKDFTIVVNDLEYATPYVSDIQSQWNLQESSNPYVNAMLFGCSLDLDGDASTPNTISYSVVTSGSTFSYDYRGNDYGSPHTSLPIDSSSSFEEAVDKAFQLFSQITGITFIKVIETETQCGDIRIGLTNADVSWAGISFVDIYKQNAYYKDSGDSDVWLANASYNTDGDWADGTFGFSTLLHEIGHSLGLKHPHNSFYPNGSGFNSPLMPLAYDAQYWTVMAYRDYVGDNLVPSPDSINGPITACGVCGVTDDYNLYGHQSMETKSGAEIYPYTPMFLDILALRYMYSFNEQTQSYLIPDTNSEDTTYNITGPVDFTIFDTGGTDTIDFSTLSLDATINLNGILSFIGTDEINFDDGEFYTGFIIGVYWPNSIENVKAGPGNDIINCNDAENTIYCGQGLDTVSLISSGDSVYGEGGDDTFMINDTEFTLIDGGEGFDTINFQDFTNINSIDFRTFNDDQIFGIEAIETRDSLASVLKLNKASVLNLNSNDQRDIDEDGDTDYVVSVYADPDLDNIVLDPENWAFYKTSNGWDYYQNGTDTYIAVLSNVGVYEISASTTSSITNQSIDENIVNGVIGTLSMINGQQLSPTNTLSYTLSGNDADKFEITNNNTLQLKSGTVANFENQSSYNITITLTFISGSQTIGVAKDLTISVTDAEENTISGTGSSDTITGTDVDDHIDSNGGDDVIDGKGGNDTLLILDDRNGYEVITLAGITKVDGTTGSNNPYYNDTITTTNVENIMFADTSIALETTLDNATYYYGNSSAETITGTDGKDVIDSGGGSDTIDGGTGDDTLLLFANKSTFDITVTGDTVTLTGNSSEGLAGAYYLDTITLTNVETIMFADQTVQVSELSSSSSQGIPDTVDNDNPDHLIPITPDGDAWPYPITFPDISLWAEEHDLGLINLPLVAIDSAPLLVDVEASLEGLLSLEESMELDFTLFSENLEPLDTVPVKPITEPTSDPYTESYYQDVMEDWMLIPMS